MFTCRPIPGWLWNGDGNEVRERREGGRKVGRKEAEKVKNSAPVFLKSLEQTLLAPRVVR